MPDFLNRLATGRTVLSLWIGLIITSVLWFSIGPASRLMGTGVPLLDTQTGYTPDQAYQQLSSYGELGRSAYVQFLAGDFFWIAFVGLAAAALILLALKRYDRDEERWTLVLLIPLFVVLLDWFENTSLLIATLRHPTRLDGLISLVPAATSAKVFASNVMSVLIALSLMALLAAAVTRRPTTPGATD